MEQKTTSLFVAVIAALFLASFGSLARAQYVEHDLVADVASHASNVDPLMIDPWGLVFDRGQFVAAENGKDETPGAGGGGVATIYDHKGNISGAPITVPAAPSFGDIAGTPTGVVVNPCHEFMISKNGKKEPADLIFDTLDGTISAWSPKLDPSSATIVIDNSTETPIPASYTALAIAKVNGRCILYAADSGISPAMSNNAIVMYDGQFNKVGQFGDPGAPSNMTVFGINLIGNELYVTYAAFSFIQGGVVDVFDLDGNLLRQFAANSPAGPLEEPWAVALAPKGFGKLGGSILVGDVSDGLINAFDPATGKFLARVESSSGTLITLPGLWTLLFHGNRMYFTAGPSFPPNSGPFGVFEDGLFGYIEAGHSGN